MLKEKLLEWALRDLDKFGDSKWVLQKIPVWDEQPVIQISTDQKLDNFFWSMTGSYFLEPHDSDIYIVDLSSYEMYDVRPGFAKYGGKVYLKEARIIRIEYLGEVYHPGNTLIQKVIWATLSLKMLFEIYILRTGLKISENRTNFSILCDFLDLDFYDNFNNIIGNKSLTQRLFALTPESYDLLVKNISEQSAFTFDTYSGGKFTRWNDQISQYLNIVKIFLSEVYSDLENIDEIADFFVISTAIRNQFGIILQNQLIKIYINRPGYISELDEMLLSTMSVLISSSKNVIRKKVVGNPEEWNRFIGNINKFESYWFDPKTF